MKKAGFAAVLVLLSLFAARVAHADASFTDPAGDAGTAPDITALAAANDTSGNITFTVTTNQPALSADAALELAIDQDNNATTGDEGVDALFVIASDGWIFLRWNGSDFVEANASSTSALYANGVATFKVNKADLGGTSTLGFVAVSVQFDAADNVVASDLAPDGGRLLTYTLTTPPPPPAPVPLTLRASTPKAPKPAKAGRAFVVRTNVVRGDTGAPLASGKVACRVTLGLKPLRAAGTLKAGAASCTMALPKTAHGKRIRGTITVTFNGKSVTKPFGFRVP